MQWLWIRQTTGSMGTYNDVMKQRQSTMQVFCKLSEDLWRAKDGKYKRSISLLGRNQEAWNKAMETIGGPKQMWDGMRERFMLQVGYKIVYQ